MEKQMVSTFMEITACESQEYAVQHLGSCRWNLDEAINLYFNSGGGAAANPSGVPAPIAFEAEAVMKEDDDNYDDAGFGDGDDVRAPIPARVETLYEYGDAYYYGGRRGGGAFDAPFGGETPEPVTAFSVQPTGWGEEVEPGYGGQAGAEDMDAGGGDNSHDDAAEQESNNNINEDGGRMVSNDDDEEDKDGRSDGDEDMSYNSSDEMDDYGLEMDEDDDAYLDGVEEDEQQQPPRPRQQQQQQTSSLADMYKLPVDLMCSESFHYAKVRAAREDRFLLVNLQAQDFQSELYNRDLWSDEQVRGVVKESFVLFLVQKEESRGRRRTYLPDECSTVCTFYKLEHDQLPAVLVLDPITGMLLEKWSGPMTPEEYLKFVGAYTTSKPSDMSKTKFVASAPAAAATVVEPEPASPTEIAKPATEANGEQQPDDKSAPAATGVGKAAEEPVPVPEAEMVEEDDDEEPMEGEKMYRLRIRFPDGTMVTKEFGCNRRVASLFKLCRTTVRGGGEAAMAAEDKAFRVVRFAGGRFEAVQGDGGATFEDLDLNCATVSVVFDA
ncbi:unnamed protein product [Urochloa humidicola]